MKRKSIAEIALLLALAWAMPLSVQSRYARPDLVNVPVERLTRNLEELAKKNPQDVQTRLNLARAYAMAYALKTDTAQVQKNRENEGVWFGNEPRHVPFAAQPTGDKDKPKAAKEHLAKAIEWYGEVLKLAPNSLTAALGHAWCVEQSGEKQEAVKLYRKIIEAAWEEEKDLKDAPFAGPRLLPRRPVI